MRRRLERNLHDGLQQRLVSLSLMMRIAQERLHPEPAGAAGRPLSRHPAKFIEAVDELRETTRGIHPAVLSEGGLGPALRAARPPVARPGPACTSMPGPGTRPRRKSTAYYVVAEALTNTTKHARAMHAEVTVEPLGQRTAGAGPR